MVGFLHVTNKLSIFKTLWDKSKHIYKLDVTYIVNLQPVLWFPQRKKN